MNTDENKPTENNKVTIDTKEVAAKLSFLVGRTILFRDGYEDVTTATSVVAVKAENSPGTAGHPYVRILTGTGVNVVTKSREFANIMLLETDGSLKSLGEYADTMGISF